MFAAFMQCYFVLEQCAETDAHVAERSLKHIGNRLAQ